MRARNLLLVLVMATSFREIRDDVLLRAKSMQGLHEREWPVGHVESLVKSAYEQVYNRVVRLNENYFTKTATISWVADQQEYDLPDDCLRVKQIRVTGTGATPYKLTQGIALNKDQHGSRYPYPRGQTVPSDGTVNGLPYEWYVAGTNSVGFRPTPASATSDAVTVEYIPKAIKPFSGDNYAFSVESWNYATPPQFLDGVDTATPVTGVTTEFDPTLWTGYLTEPDYVHVLRGNDALRFDGTTKTSGSTTMQFNVYGGQPVNLGTGPDDAIVASFYVASDATKITHVAIYIATTSDFSNAFYKDVAMSSLPLRQGWNHIAIPRSGFSSTGSPRWESVEVFELRFQMTTATGNELDVTFDGFCLDPSVHVSTPTNLADSYRPQAAPGWDTQRCEPEFLSEWITLETLLRLVPTLPNGFGGQAPNKGIMLLRDEVRDNVLRTISTRSVQSIRRVGEVIE